VPRFRVIGIVRSTNKGAKNVGTWVNAANKEEAKRRGKTKLTKDNPNGIVQVTNAEEREPTGPVEPEPEKRRPWWR
jgi:hypothetical protein